MSPTPAIRPTTSTPRPARCCGTTPLLVKAVVARRRRAHHQQSRRAECVIAARRTQYGWRHDPGPGVRHPRRLRVTPRLNGWTWTLLLDGVEEPRPARET